MTTSVRVPVGVLVAAVAVAAAALAVLVTILVTDGATTEQVAADTSAPLAASVETTVAPRAETRIVEATTTSEPALIIEESDDAETSLPVFNPALTDSAYGCLQDLLDIVDAYFAIASGLDDRLDGPSDFGIEGLPISGGWCGILESDAATRKDINVRSAYNRVKAANPGNALWIAVYLRENGESVDRASLLRQARAFEDAVFRFADELGTLGLELP